MKFEALQTYIAELAGDGEIIVTYSGGVDSALVLLAATRAIGPRALGLTAVSPTLPVEEVQAAIALAAEMGARHELIDAHELENELYAANTGDRCYHCKSELFGIAAGLALARGARAVLDGTIVDDLGDDRPGLRAAAEHGVQHPLLHVGYTKGEVRADAKALGLNAWDKPSFACLGSRFAPGMRVTLERVLRIAKVETALRTAGLRQFRARFEGESVRIEVDPAEMAALVAAREDVLVAAKAQGFARVTLDLAGYRSRG